MMAMTESSPVVPPNAFETEQGLLGAILQNPDALERARDHVRAEDFFDPVHQRVFEVMCQRRDVGEPIDLLLMVAALGNADFGNTTMRAYLVRLC